MGTASYRSRVGGLLYGLSRPWLFRAPYRVCLIVLLRLFHPEHTASSESAIEQTRLKYSAVAYHGAMWFAS